MLDSSLRETSNNEDKWAGQLMYGLDLTLSCKFWELHFVKSGTITLKENPSNLNCVTCSKTLLDSQETELELVSCMNNCSNCPVVFVWY